MASERDRKENAVRRKERSKTNSTLYLHRELYVLGVGGCGRLLGSSSPCLKKDTDKLKNSFIPLVHKKGKMFKLEFYK